MPSIFERLAARIAAAPRLTLLFVVLSLPPTIWLSAKLPLDGSFFALLPEQDRAVIELRRGIVRTGGSAYAMIAIGAADRPVAERFADALDKRLSTLSCVRFVEARRDLEFVRAHALLFLSKARLEEMIEKLRDEVDDRTIDASGLGLDLEDKSAKTKTSSVPMIDLDRMIEDELHKAEIPTDPYSVGKDGKYLYVFVALKGDAGDLTLARSTQDELERATLEVRAQGDFPKDLELRFSGTNVVRLEDEAQLRIDLANASLLSFFGVLLLLVIYTRQLRTLVVLSVPLLAGISWTFAFAWFAVGHLNIISGFLVTILSGLGVEFGIHMLLRYAETRRAGELPEVAQAIVLKTTGRSLVGSGLTNAAAFFVVSFAGFEGFSEFGLIAGFGMILTLVLMLVGFPALNLTLERWRPMKIRPLPPRSEQGIHVPKPLRTFIMVLIPALMCVSVYHLSRGEPRFRTNWREIKGDSPASDFDDYIAESLDTTLTQTMILVNNSDEIPRVKELLTKHLESRKLRNLPTGIRNFLSLHDLVPPDQSEKLPLLLDLERELSRIKPERLNEREKRQLERAFSLARAQPFELSEVPPSLKQRMLTADGLGSLVLLRANYFFYESDQLMSWAEEVDELSEALHAQGLDTPIISENWVTGKIFFIIQKDGPFILFATIIVVFLVVLIDFRRLSHALLVMGAVLSGHISLAGMMATLGVELNFINITVVPIIIGVSIDNAMHILHRYLEEGPSSIPLVLRHTASATTLSSATNLMGFGAMLVAHHAGLRSIAHLAILGIGLTFLSTSVFFPLALEWWGEKTKKA